MLLRTMTTHDYAAVCDLWSHTPGVCLHSIDDSLKSIEGYLKRNPNTCFVVEDAQRIVGVILSGHDGRRGFIYHMAVRPDTRRQGIGSQLVKASLTALQQDGIRKVALLVLQNNTLGNTFWESLGFTEREDLVYRNYEIDACGC